MHTHTLHRWKHEHRFYDDSGHGEHATWQVIILTVVMMVVEIIGGMVFGSMALLADGWHMGTHATTTVMKMRAIRGIIITIRISVPPISMCWQMP